MKRATFKLDPSKGGWLRTTIAPLNNKGAGRFGYTDIVMFFALVAAVAGVARVLLAH